MPKGVPLVTYSGEFKQRLVEDMRENQLAHKATARKYGINDRQVRNWERIYLEEGPMGLYIERRGRGSKGRPVKLDKKIEEDLIAENQRLRAEIDYLKKLNALVLEEERQYKRHK